MPPFPSVAPDAPSTTGTINAGDVAVVADQRGPALLIRVRDVEQFASVPGVTPVFDGDVFIEATVDFLVLHPPAGNPPGIGRMGWKTFGGRDLGPDAPWPTPHLDQVQDPTAGQTLTGKLGWEVPPAGQVLLRYWGSAGVTFEVVLRDAYGGASPSPFAASGWPVAIAGQEDTSAALGPNGSLYLAPVNVGTNEPGDAIALDASGHLRPGWPVRLPFGGWVSGVAVAPDGTLYVTGTGGLIAAFAPDGTMQPDWPVTIPGADQTYAPMVASAGTLYLVASSASGPAEVVALAPDGTMRHGWPITLRGSVASPVLGPDGTLYLPELPSSPSPGQRHATIEALSPAGAVRPGWPIGGWDGIGLAPDGTVVVWSWETLGSSPDSSMEVVRRTRVAAIGADGRPKPGWPVTIDGPASAPAFGPRGTIYLTLGDAAFGHTGSILALDGEGRIEEGWPASLPSGTGGLAAHSMPASLLVAQSPVVGPDGRVYVVCEGSDRSLVVAFDSSGKIGPGWPYTLPPGLRFGHSGAHAVPGGPAIAPIPGEDGQLYVAVTTASGGGIVALGPDGHPASGWPVSLPSQAIVSWFAAAPRGGVVVAGAAIAADGSPATIVTAYGSDGTVLR